MEHTVFSSESLINPLGTIGVASVAEVDSFGTKFPRLDVVRDMKGRLDISSVEVVRDGHAECAWGQHAEFVRVGFLLVKEWSVVCSCVNLFEFVRCGIVHLRIWVGAVADAVDVVDVNITHEALKLVEQVHALRGGVWHSHSTEIAVVGLDSEVGLFAIQ